MKQSKTLRLTNGIRMDALFTFTAKKKGVPKPFRTFRAKKGVPQFRLYYVAYRLSKGNFRYASMQVYNLSLGKPDFLPVSLASALEAKKGWTEHSHFHPHYQYHIDAPKRTNHLLSMRWQMPSLLWAVSV